MLPRNSLWLALAALSLPAAAQDAFTHVKQGLDALRKRFPGAMTIEEHGRSREDRPLLVARIGRSAGGPRALDRRPSILLVAGLDGRRTDDPDIVLRNVEALLADTSKATRAILDRFTLYAIPCANPDGLARGIRGNAGAHDDDRDGREGEDGPEDLDRDGLVSWMLVPDPKGRWLIDPEDAGISREADPAKNERGHYLRYREGRDDDGDHKYSEDGPGGADPDRNFPHLYVEHGPGAGAYVLSEPCALGLADFVIGKPCIELVVCYGAHDNLLEDPAKNTAKDRNAPTGVDPDDIWIWSSFGATYRELTGRKDKNRGDWNGRFHAWVYAHLGLPCLATSLVDHPAPDASASDTAKWLREGFGKDAVTEFTAFAHPQLGEVMIGGARDALLHRIPKAERAAVQKRELDFLTGLFAKLCRLDIAAVSTKRVGDHVTEIKAVVTNEGFLPPRTRMGARLRRPRQPRLELLRRQDGKLVPIRAGTTRPRLVAGSSWRFVGVAKRGSNAEFRWLVDAPAGTGFVVRLVQERMVWAEKEVAAK